MIIQVVVIIIGVQPQPVSLDDLQLFPDEKLSLYCYGQCVLDSEAHPKPEAWQHPLPHHYDNYNWCAYKRKAWDLLTNAQITYYSPKQRENNLRQLRELIGFEAYYSGRLPY